MIMIKKQSKNQAGFMLIEVMVAVMLLAIISIALLNLQSNLVNRVWREQQNSEHLILLQNVFYNPQMQSIAATNYDQERAIKQSNSFDFKNLDYELLPLNSKSELFSKYQNIYVQKSSGSWQGTGRDLQDELISLIGILPENSNQKKSDAKITEPNLPKTVQIQAVVVK